MSALETAYETLKAAIGTESPPGDWFTVTQEQVDQFADVTGDHQWIHVDVERSKQGPFGGTIAHGHLTLSILGLIGRTDKPSTRGSVDGQKMGINYGFNRVRFPAPVPVGCRIRSKRTLRSVEIKGDMIEAMSEVVVEVEGQDKPACVAESLSRMVF